MTNEGQELSRRAMLTIGPIANEGPVLTLAVVDVQGVSCFVCSRPIARRETVNAVRGKYAHSGRCSAIVRGLLADPRPAKSAPRVKTR